MIIQKFQGKYFFLSNFFLCPILYKGKAYPSAEYLFQALKTKNKDAREVIRLAPTPARAKRLGRHVKLRPDWEKIKDDVMFQVLIFKFAQNHDLQSLLKKTAGYDLEEGNMWHDQYWGSCRCKKHIDVQGRNQLGKALMKLRNQLLLT